MRAIDELEIESVWDILWLSIQFRHDRDQCQHE